MACSKMNIKTTMIDLSTKWHGLHPNKSQTSLFREVIPIDDSDFSTKFRSSGLSQIFTGGRIRIGSGFNCNHLYRDIRTVPHIIIYSDAKNTVIAPLGEPGRDVPKYKIGHLMVLSHSDDGPVTFNELLPSTMGELEDLEGRLKTINTAVQMLRSNARISDCGSRVVEKANTLSVPDTMGIQEFFAYQILNMKDSVRSGFSNGGEGPGYVLNDNDGVEYGRDEDKVRSTIQDVFGGTLRGRVFIQGPDKNTQILSHIHLFMLSDEEELPEKINQNYLDVEVILEVKKDFLTDVPLVRVRTPPSVEVVPEEDETLSRTQSSRNYAHRDD